MFKPSPLCKTHFVPLIGYAIATINDNSTEWQEGFDHCPSPNCHCYYSPSRGYIEINNHQLSQIDQLVPCTTYQDHGFRAVIAVANGDLIWQCLNEACLCGSGVSQELIRVGGIVSAQGQSISRFQVLNIENNWSTIQLMGNASDGQGLHHKAFWLHVPVSSLMRCPLADNDFVAGRGYRCVLPDLNLFVEKDASCWFATAYDRMGKVDVMKMSFASSENSKQHCQVFVNSFRGGSNLPLLKAPLDWEIYGFPLSEIATLTHA